MFVIFTQDRRDAGKILGNCIYSKIMSMFTITVLYCMVYSLLHVGPTVSSIGFEKY